MRSVDAFALQRSDLNAFLFAEVGTERNGMALTVASVIARLGVDPWNEARRLSTLPKAAAIDYVAGIISRMPASLWSFTDATVIATRLVALLPSHPAISRQSINWNSSKLPTPRSMRMLLLCGALGVWLALNLIVFSGHPPTSNGPNAPVGARELQSRQARPSAVPANITGLALIHGQVEGAEH